LHFSKKSESFLFSLFTSRTSKTHSRWSLTSTKAPSAQENNHHHEDLSSEIKIKEFSPSPLIIPAYKIPLFSDRDKKDLRE